MSLGKSQRERLLALALTGIVAINYPLLSLFSKVALFLGIPVLFLYLFSFWGVYIGLSSLIIEKSTGPDSRPPDTRPSDPRPLDPSALDQNPPDIGKGG